MEGIYEGKIYGIAGDLLSKKDYTRFTILVGSLLLAYGLFNLDLFMMAIGAVVIYVSLYSKDVVIDRNGMTTHYHAIIYDKSRTYPFTDFTELGVRRGDGPETMVGFVRNGMHTPCAFHTNSDAEGVIHMAKEGNPRIIVREIPFGRRADIISKIKRTVPF